MSSLHHTGPHEKVPARFNLAAHVLARAGELGEKPALEIVSPAGAREVWSYARLERAVLGVARGLREAGLGPGDRVLLRLGNDVDFPLAFLGAIAADLVPVPTSPQLTKGEISRLAAQIAPALIVAADGIALPDPLPCEVMTRAALDALTHSAPWQIVAGDPERLAYIIFTSGTGARPRAVAHAHRAIWARRMMIKGWYGLTHADRLMHAGAFNWTYTLGTGLMDPWSVGATALIPAAGTGTGDLPGLMARHGATILAATPGVYRQALRRQVPPLPALRHGLSAGEKLPEPTRARWKEATGREIYEAFGMSECSTFISASPARPAPQGALGYAQEGRRVAVLDEDGKPVARGQPGALAVARDDPGLMLGYLDAPEATRARLRGEWFLSGDMAVMAPDGAISYLGRGDDMLNAGGFRVSPVEVEAAIVAHPGVHEAAAVEIAVSDEASIIACAYVPEAAAVPEAELSAHAHGLLAHYKCPRVFRPVDALPRGANNKLLRRVIRQGWT